MHPVLIVEAAPGIVYVNGRYAGETGGPVTPLLRDGVCFVEYHQFDKWGAGLAFRLVMKSGMLVDGLPQDVYAVQWPSGLLEIEIHTETDDTPPQILQSLQTPYGMLHVMSRGDALLVGYEGGQATELPVIGPFFDIRVQTQPHPTMPLIIILGDGDEGAFSLLVRLDNPPLLMQTGAGQIFPGESRIKREYLSASDAARAWLEAVQDGDHAKAAAYLQTPSLQRRFSMQLGDFEQIVPLKTPVPGLAPVEWGILRLVTPQIAHVEAVGFVCTNTENGWRIESVIVN